MTVIAGCLLIAFVASNGLWLAFFRQHLKEDNRERWELRERDRDGGKPINAPELTDWEKDQMAQTREMARDRIEESDDEFDLVGRTNPPTPLRTDEPNG